MKKLTSLLAACSLLIPGIHFLKAEPPAASSPSSGKRATLVLQDLVDEAIRNKKTVLRLPSGPFTVLGSADIHKAENFTLVGDNTTLYFSPENNYFRFTSCRNVAVKNLTIDSDPLPFTQATVTAIAPDYRWIQYQVHEGYPRLKEGDFPGKSGVFVFDPSTRDWRQEVPDIYPSRAEVLSATTGRLYYGGSQPGNKLVRAGDLIAFKNHGANAFGFQGCDGVRLENVTVQSAGLGAFILRRCEGEIRLESCRIERGPKPLGATENRLISTNADGLNLGYCRKGVIMENCDFAWMGDDGVNLHGTIQTIVAVEGEKVIWTANVGFPEYIVKIKEGDAANILSKPGFGQKASVPISAAVREKNPPAEVEAAARKILNAGASTKLEFARLELAQAVEAAPGDSVEVPAIACPDFVIRNNRFHNHRARGIRIGASRGVIENNHFEAIKSSAITLGPHAVHHEGGWVHDVIVRGNIITNVGFDDRAFEAGSYNPGAICIQHFLFNGAPYPQGNSGIVIENNTIRNVGGPGIMAISAKDSVIRKNTIEASNQRDTTGTGRKVDLVAGGAITLNHCADVVVEDNKMDKPGSHASAPVVTHPSSPSGK